MNESDSQTKNFPTQLVSYSDSENQDEKKEETSILSNEEETGIILM